MRASDFTVIDGVPRDTIANALQVQGQTDAAIAITRVREAFKIANAKVMTANTQRVQDVRDAVASARLAINAACDAFAVEINDATRVFEAGVDLQSEETDPPIEENANA